MSQTDVMMIELSKLNPKLLQISKLALWTQKASLRYCSGFVNYPNPETGKNEQFMIITDEIITGMNFIEPKKITDDEQDKKKKKNSEVSTSDEEFNAGLLLQHSHNKIERICYDDNGEEIKEEEEEEVSEEYINNINFCNQLKILLNNVLFIKLFKI